MIHPDSVLTPAEGVVQEDFGDSVMVGDASGNHWLILRGTAIDIWQLLQEPRSSDALRQALAERFAGDPGQMRADIESFLEQLLHAGIIQEAAHR